MTRQPKESNTSAGTASQVPETTSKMAETAEEQPPLQPRVATAHRGWILTALMLTMALAAMDITIVATAIPQIVGDLGGFELFSWLFSIYLLTQTASLPIYGKLADLYGRKPVIIGGSLLFLLGSLLCAVAWSMPALIVFRGIQGLGASSIMATVNTLAGDLYSVKERGKIQGLLSSVWGVAAIAGPTLGGFFAEYVSWHWVFLINLPVGLLAVWLLARYLHEYPPALRPQIDYSGAFLMMAAGSMVVFGLLQGGTAWSWLSLPSIVSFVLALLLIVATIYRQRTAPDPIMPGWVWRRRALLGPNLGAAGMGLLMMAPSAYLPVYAQAVLGLGAISAGLVLASMSLGWMSASWLSGRLYLHLGFRDTALIGAVLMALGIATFTLLPANPSPWWVVANQIFLGAGFGMFSTPLLVGVQSIVPWSERGVVTSAHMWSRYVGQSLGAAVVGAIFNGAMLQQFHSNAAPSGLPAIDDVVHALQEQSLSGMAYRFVLEAFDLSTRSVYMSMTYVAVLTLILVFLIAPRHNAASVS